MTKQKTPMQTTTYNGTIVQAGDRLSFTRVSGGKIKTSTGTAVIYENRLVLELDEYPLNGLYVPFTIEDDPGITLHRPIAAFEAMKGAIAGLLRYWDRNNHTTIQLEKVEDHIHKMRKALALAEGKEEEV